jgi:putative oxidoreductase
MENRLAPIQPLIGVTGRILLGLYFLLPGISKITGFEGTIQYMEVHGVPAVAALLPITIVLQLGGGAALIAGWQIRATALMLAGMTLVINVFMHDFWNVYEGLSQQHETQNFVKNLAIMAGLLALAAGPASGRWSLDQRNQGQNGS